MCSKYFELEIEFLSMPADRAHVLRVERLHDDGSQRTRLEGPAPDAPQLAGNDFGVAAPADLAHPAQEAGPRHALRKVEARHAETEQAHGADDLGKTADRARPSSTAMFRL